MPNFELRIPQGSPQQPPPYPATPAPFVFVQGRLQPQPYTLVSVFIHPPPVMPIVQTDYFLPIHFIHSPPGIRQPLQSASLPLHLQAAAVVPPVRIGQPLQVTPPPLAHLHPPCVNSASVMKSSYGAASHVTVQHLPPAAPAYSSAVSNLPPPLDTNEKMVLERLTELKSIWRHAEVQPTSQRNRIFQTICMVFNLSHLLGINNGIRLYFKDTPFCFRLIDAVFSDQALKALEAFLLQLIEPILNCTTSSEIKTALVSRAIPARNEAAHEQLISLIGSLILNLGVTEKQQQENIAFVHDHRDLLAFAVGQIIQNLPIQYGERDFPLDFSQTLKAGLNKALIARNAFAHDKGKIETIQDLATVGEQLILVILQECTQETIAKESNQESVALSHSKKRKSRARPRNILLTEAPPNDIPPSSFPKADPFKNELLSLKIKAQKYLDSNRRYKPLMGYSKLYDFLNTVDEQPATAELIQRLSMHLKHCEQHIDLQKKDDEVKKKESMEDHEINKLRQGVKLLIHALKNTLQISLSSNERYQDFKEDTQVSCIVSQYQQKIEAFEASIERSKTKAELSALEKTLKLAQNDKQFRSFKKEFDYALGKAIENCVETEKKARMLAEKSARKQQDDQRKHNQAQSSTKKLACPIKDIDPVSPFLPSSIFYRVSLFSPINKAYSTLDAVNSQLYHRLSLSQLFRMLEEFILLPSPTQLDIERLRNKYDQLVLRSVDDPDIQCLLVEMNLRLARHSLLKSKHYRRYTDEAMSLLQRMSEQAPPKPYLTDRLARACDELVNTIEPHTSPTWFKEALFINAWSLSLVQAQKNAPLTAAYHYYDRAEILRKHQRFDAAITFLNTALSLFRNHDENVSENVANVFESLALCFYSKEDYPSSRRSLDQALRIRETLYQSHPEKLALHLFNIGKLYAQLREKKAFHVLNKCISISEDNVNSQHSTKQAKQQLAMANSLSGRLMITREEKASFYTALHRLHQACVIWKENPPEALVEQEEFIYCHLYSAFGYTCLLKADDARYCWSKALSLINSLSPSHALHQNPICQVASELYPLKNDTKTLKRPEEVLKHIDHLNNQEEVLFFACLAFSEISNQHVAYEKAKVYIEKLEKLNKYRDHDILVTKGLIVYWRALLRIVRLAPTQIITLDEKMNALNSPSGGERQEQAEADENPQKTASLS